MAASHSRGKKARSSWSLTEKEGRVGEGALIPRILLNPHSHIVLGFGDTFARPIPLRKRTESHMDHLQGELTLFSLPRWLQLGVRPQV